MTELLRVQNLGVSYAGLVAVDGVTLSIGEGDVLGVAGPNGAGKSSLLRAIAGLVKPSQGQVTFDGKAVDKGPQWAVRHGIVIVPEGRHLFGELTVLCGGCVELVNRRPTGRHFHEYLNPEREIDAGAAKVHGMTLADLASKPRFCDVATRLLEFIDGAELVIHNAPFDVAFLDAEFARWARDGSIELCTVRGRCRVLDTLAVA
jgi:energy-coupling factor transporter ATP-binding protein EcfA2